MNNTITARQAGILCVMTILANKVSLLPALLYEGAKADGFFIMLMFFGIELGILGIFFALKSKYPNERLYSILQKHLGSVITKFIYILLMFFFLFKVTLTYSVGYVYLKEQVYQDEFAMIAIVCILPVVNHAVIKGLRTFSRTIEFCYVFIIIGVLVSIGIGLANFQDIPLFFTSTPQGFFGSSFRHVFAFGDFIFLFLIIDKVDFEKKERVKILNYILFGFALVLAIFFIFYSVYKGTGFMHNNALDDILAFCIKFCAMGQLNVIAMLTVMALNFFQLEIFTYCFSEAFCSVFPKLNRTYSVIVFDVLFFLIYFVFVERFTRMIYFTHDYLPYLAMVINYLLPLILLFCALPRRRKDEKDIQTL